LGIAVLFFSVSVIIAVDGLGRPSRSGLIIAILWGKFEFSLNFVKKQLLVA
jgi:hypothetical protein